MAFAHLLHHISSKIKLMMRQCNAPNPSPWHSNICSLLMWGCDTENHWLPGRKGQSPPHHNLLSGHSAALVWEIYQSTKLLLSQPFHFSCHPYFFFLTFSHVYYIPDLFVASFTGENFYFLYNLRWNTFLALKELAALPQLWTSIQLSCLKYLCFLKIKREKTRRK